MGNIFMTYRRDFNNLTLQERRLRNQRQADLAELRALQKERFERERKSLRSARKKSAAPKRSMTMPAPTTLSDFAELGFDFSKEEYLAYANRNWDYLRLTDTDMHIDKFLAEHRKERK